MAVSFRAAVGVALLVVCTVACKREPSRQDTADSLISGCPCDVMKLSDAQLRRLTGKARSGDLSAAKELWEHYTWYDDFQHAAPWEERLSNAGEPEVIGYRSDMLFS